MAQGITNVNDTTFGEEVLHSEQPVIVDFWAEWCGPCKLIAPILEEIAVEHPEFKVVKLDIDDNPRTTLNYDVMSVPTVMLFKDGGPVERLVGARPKRALLDQFLQHV